MGYRCALGLCLILQAGVKKKPAETAYSGGLYLLDVEPDGLAMDLERCAWIPVAEGAVRPRLILEPEKRLQPGVGLDLGQKLFRWTSSYFTVRQRRSMNTLYRARSRTSIESFVPRASSG
jgi:hypothetical protein